MAYVTPKAILNEYLAQLRAWTTEPLKSCVFRKGPQRVIKLAGTETGFCIVALRELVGGEDSAGSGNNWWHNWQFAVLLAVPDDEEDPEASEDARLDLIEQFGQFQHQIAARTLFGGAKVGRISSCTLGIGAYFENTTQVFRYAEITVDYRTLRS